MKSLLYLLLAGLVVATGYLGYERFVAQNSADANTLGVAQGSPPPPARLPQLAQDGAAVPARLPEGEEPAPEPTATTPPPVAPVETPGPDYEPPVEEEEDDPEGNPDDGMTDKERECAGSDDPFSCING